MYNISIYMGAGARFRARASSSEAKSERSEIRRKKRCREQKRTSKKAARANSTWLRRVNIFFSVIPESTSSSSTSSLKRHVSSVRCGERRDIFQGTSSAVRRRLHENLIPPGIIDLSSRVNNKFPARKFSANNFLYETLARTGRGWDEDAATAPVILPKIHRPGAIYSIYISIYIRVE